MLTAVWSTTRSMSTAVAPKIRRLWRRPTNCCGNDKGMAWIGLYRPTAEDICRSRPSSGCTHLAVDDAIAAHQRPKLERYGALLFTVLRPARYIDQE